MRKRTLLIVEDDELHNTFYQMHCEEVLKELPHTEGNILQAFDYEQAKNILNTQSVDFISIDLALSKAEQGLTEIGRETKDVGGMTLLKELQGNEKRPISVVVTGETLQSYAIDAYRKHGVLAFYQKARFNDQEYRNAVKAALWYLEAGDAIERLEIEEAANSWKKAEDAANLAGIQERDFENLRYKIQSMRDGLTHSTTGLPIGRWTEEKLKRKVVGYEGNWTVIYVVIKGFNNFVSVFPSQERPILDFVAALLKRMRTEFQDEAMFIGHLGYREHSSEPGFVIVPNEKHLHQTTEIANWVVREFAKIGSKPFASEPELKDNQEKDTHKELTFILETKVLPDAEHNFFSDLPFLLDTLSLPD